MLLKEKKLILEKVLVKVLTQILHTLENPPRFTFLQAIDVPEEGKGNTLFYNQFLAYEALPEDIKQKIENLKGIFSSQGKIAQTRELRMADHGTSGTKEIKSEHKLVQSIKR